MTQPHPRDAMDELRRANPYPADRLPPVRRARLWARIQEETMADRESAPPSRRGASRQPLPRWGLALSGIAIAGVAAAAFVLAGGAPDGAPGNSPGTGIGSCVETYSLDTLANRSWAFDGTVTAISGDQVTFTVNEAFTGDVGNEITLTASGMTATSITSAGGPSLTVGERYLVAGEDEFVWACGFTQPYDAAVAAQWADTTR